MSLAVTTVMDPTNNVCLTAKEYAAKLNVPFIERGKTSISNIQKLANPLLVVTKTGSIVYGDGGKFFFHLNMAELRIKNIRQGNGDRMIEAMDLQPGMSVLDCTLGLATDSIVASYVTGPTGSVIGLEHSPIIALVVSEGLAHFTCTDNDISHALKRIQVVETSYQSYLAALPRKSVDIVYFDPMFRKPIVSSCALQPMRSLADNSAITEQAINMACKIAKSRVVIKESYYSKEFLRLGITTLTGGKYSNIRYGIIEVS